MKEFKTIIRYSSFVLPTLTFMSLCKLMLYYYLFNINISQFFSLEEILTPFIADGLIYLLFFIIPCVILFIFLEDTVGVANTERVIKRKEIPFQKRFFAGFRENMLMLIGYTFGTIILILNKQPIEYIFGALGALPLMNIIFWLRNEILIKKGIVLNSQTIPLINISTLIITVFILIIPKTFLDAHQVKISKHTKSRIELKEKTISLGDSLSYIGKTKNYTFLYNKISKGALIISNSEITKYYFNY